MTGRDSLIDWHRERARSQAVDMQKIGDNLQSEASRLAAWVRSDCTDELPYEVAMALVAVERATQAWTELRRLPEIPTSGFPRSRPGRIEP